jgi:hypothetical protein
VEFVSVLTFAPIGELLVRWLALKSQRKCVSDRVVNWALTNVSHRSVLMVLSIGNFGAGHSIRDLPFGPYEDFGSLV